MQDVQYLEYRSLAGSALEMQKKIVEWRLFVDAVAADRERSIPKAD